MVLDNKKEIIRNMAITHASFRGWGVYQPHAREEVKIKRAELPIDS